MALGLPNRLPSGQALLDVCEDLAGLTGLCSYASRDFRQGEVLLKERPLLQWAARDAEPDEAVALFCSLGVTAAGMFVSEQPLMPTMQHCQKTAHEFLLSRRNLWEANSLSRSRLLPGTCHQILQTAFHMKSCAPSSVSAFSIATISNQTTQRRFLRRAPEWSILVNPLLFLCPNGGLSGRIIAGCGVQVGASQLEKPCQSRTLAERSFSGSVRDGSRPPLTGMVFYACAPVVGPSVAQCLCRRHCPPALTVVDLGQVPSRRYRERQ